MTPWDKSNQKDLVLKLIQKFKKKREPLIRRKDYEDLEAVEDTFAESSIDRRYV